MSKKAREKLYVSDTHDIDESMGAVMPILMDCDKDEDFSEGMDKVGETLPILPLRNMVLFPGVAMPIFVGRPKSMRLIREASQRKILVGVVCQKDAEVEEPGLDDLYPIGTVAEVLRVLEMPDGSTTAILQGRKRMALHGLVDTEPYLNGAISLLDDQPAGKDDREYEALISTIKDLTIKMIEAAGDPPRELVFSIRNMQNTMYMLGFACCHIVANPDEKQELLAIGDVKNRAYRLLFILNREYQLIELKTSIQMKTHEDINKQQKEYFLQQQMKAIQEELGGKPRRKSGPRRSARRSKRSWPSWSASTHSRPTTPSSRNTCRRSSACRGALTAVTTSASRTPNVCSTAIITAWRRSRSASSNIWLYSSSSATCARPSSASTALRASARRRSDDPWPKRWDANTCASRWAACTTRPRSAATDAPTSAP